MCTPPQTFQEIPRNPIAFPEYAKEISFDLIFELKSRHSVADFPSPTQGWKYPAFPHYSTPADMPRVSSLSHFCIIFNLVTFISIKHNQLYFTPRWQPRPSLNRRPHFTNPKTFLSPTSHLFQTTSQPPPLFACLLPLSDLLQRNQTASSLPQKSSDFSILISATILMEKDSSPSHPSSSTLPPPFMIWAEKN